MIDVPGMMSGIPFIFKLGICICWDIVDFTVGRIPGSGSIFDIISGAVAVGMFGTVGVIAFWEVADVTDQIDGFIPTMTAIAVVSLMTTDQLDTVKTIGARRK